MAHLLDWRGKEIQVPSLVILLKFQIRIGSSACDDNLQDGVEGPDAKVVVRGPRAYQTKPANENHGSKSIQHHRSITGSVSIL
jgi:hypothetical protein